MTNLNTILRFPVKMLSFPFRATSTLMITDSKESKNDPDPCHVKIRNFVTTELSALNDIHSKLDGFPSQKDGATVLYHGTDHEGTQSCHDSRQLMILYMCTQSVRIYMLAC